MAKKLEKQFKIVAPGGKATPAPPLGPALGANGINPGQFITAFNERTKDLNGKSLLGSTMSLFGSGMSYGHSHGNANLPLVLAGGTDLGLKHGSHLDFNQGHFDGYTLNKPGDHYRLCSRPANTDAHMSNLLLLMSQKMGLETDSIGDSNKVISL